jgi:hypothetical protein
MSSVWQDSRYRVRLEPWLSIPCAARNSAGRLYGPNGSRQCGGRFLPGPPQIKSPISKCREWNFCSVIRGSQWRAEKSLPRALCGTPATFSSTCQLCKREASGLLNRKIGAVSADVSRQSGTEKISRATIATAPTMALDSSGSCVLRPSRPGGRPLVKDLWNQCRTVSPLPMV